MPPERLDRKRVPSFGVCIYCGRHADKVKLTDEHTMPFSLGGNVILEKASCLDCANVTKNFEGYLGRKVFGDFRTHAGTQTRNKKDRPSSLQAKITLRGREFVREFDVGDHPFFTSFPVLPVAGILSGDQPRREYKWVNAHVFHSIPPNIRETLGMHSHEKATLHYPDITVDTNKFARAIAKIAYCTAVMKWGIGGFRPLIIRQLILGEYPFVPYLVGLHPNASMAVANPEVMHEVSFAITEYKRLALITARVRLFANSGAGDEGPPSYEVVVGAPSIGWRQTPNPYE